MKYFYWNIYKIARIISKNNYRKEKIKYWYNLSWKSFKFNNIIDHTYQGLWVGVIEVKKTINPIEK